MSRWVTVRVTEVGGADLGAVGAWEFSASSTEDCNGPMSGLDEAAAQVLAKALKGYRSERRRSRKHHKHDVMP